MAITKVTTDVITDLAVTAPKLAADSVITDKIADNAVTAAKIAAGALTDQVAGISSAADATAITIDSSEKVFVNGGVNITTTAGNTNLQVLTTNSQAANLGGSIGMGGVYNATNQITFAEIHGKKTNSTAANVHGYMAFVTRGDNIAERMRIDSSGKVGIGTTSPSFTLHVLDTIGTRTLSLGHGVSSGTITTDSAKDLNFQQAGSTKMTLDSSGNVGIGTTSPDGLLTIPSANSDTVPRIRLQHPSVSSDASIDTFQDSSGTYLSIGSNSFQAANSALTKFNTNEEGNALRFDSGGAIQFYNASSSENLTERMRIDSSGRVLAGRSTHYGSGKVQSFIGHTANFASSSFVAADSTAVAAGVGGEIGFYGKYSSADDYAFYGGIKGFKENGTDSNTACALSFHTRPTGTVQTEQMRISSSGKVGIGTTAPGDFLHITNGDNSVDTRIRLQGFGQLPIWHTYYAAGTESSPTAPTSGTELSRFAVSTWDGNDYSQSAGQIRIVAEANHSSNVAPAYMAFDTNSTTRLATEKMRIDSSGRLLLGTSTSPNNGSYNPHYSKFIQLGNTYSSTQDGRIAVGRGTVSTSLSNGDLLGSIYFTDLSHGDYGGIQAYVDSNPGSNDHPSRLVFRTTADGSATSTERMKILSDGEIVSGPAAINDTYSPLVNGVTSDALVVGRHATSGSLGLWRTNTNEFKYYHNGIGYIMTFGSNGVLSGDFNDTSDVNLKENISSISDGTTVINALRPVKFDWKASGKGNNQHGFIAQEVETVLPDAVEGNNYVENETGLPEDEPVGNGKTMNSNAVLAHAVKAIQELEARIKVLEG